MVNGTAADHSCSGSCTGAPSVADLNSHIWRHIGHRCSVCDDNHFVMHCKWKACLHVPHTTGLSSPGYFASGAQPSKGFLQIPHTSSPAFHDHDAIVRQCFILTLNAGLSLVILPQCKPTFSPAALLLTFTSDDWQWR